MATLAAGKSPLVTQPWTVQTPGWRRSGALAVLAALAVLTGCGGESAEPTPDPEGLIGGDQVTEELSAAQDRYPLPSGREWKDFGINSDDTYGAGAAEVMVASQAQCAWYDYWLEGQRDGDDEAMDEAMAALDALSGSALFTLADPSYTDLIADIEERARLGDPSGIQQFIEQNCSSDS